MEPFKKFHQQKIIEILCRIKEDGVLHDSIVQMFERKTFGCGNTDKVLTIFFLVVAAYKAFFVCGGLFITDQQSDISKSANAKRRLCARLYRLRNLALNCIDWHSIVQSSNFIIALKYTVKLNVCRYNFLRTILSNS